jgi:hypothetical protein
MFRRREVRDQIFIRCSDLREAKGDVMSVEDAKRQQALAEEARRRGIPEWQLEASRAVPDDLVRSIVDDFRRGPSRRQRKANNRARDCPD